MLKLKYSFKEFLNKKVVHDNEWITNGHFLVKKSILTKSHLNMINKHKQDEKTIEFVLEAIKKTKESFDDATENNIIQFIPDLIILKDENNIIYNNKSNKALREKYYNFITDRKCKIYTHADAEKLDPLLIYNKDNEFVGIILPVKLNATDITKGGKIYREYIAELKKEQQEQKRAKDELKKLNKNTLYINNNKAIMRKQPLKSLADITGVEKYSNIFIEANPKDNYVELYLDLSIIHMNIGNTIRLDCIDDTDTRNLLDFLSEFTLNNYKEMIENNLKEGKWINTAEIKLMELAGESKECIDKLIKHRENIKKQKEKESREREIKRQQDEQKYINNKNKLVNDAIKNAEQAILNKEKVINEQITTYKTKYDSNTTTLILHLLKLYDIKVPLRTQGWINNALAEVFYDNSSDSYSYRYYNSSKDSTVFIKYLTELVSIIKEKYAITA